MSKNTALVSLVLNTALLLIAFLAFSYIAHSISPFTILETEKISLEPNVTDPDADKLTVTYTAPLNENGEWQTTYGDAGEYNAVITVSDGIINDSRDVLIIVKKKEEQPVINSLMPTETALSIKEAESINFKISASDLNKDNLIYEWFLDGKKVKDGEEFNYSTGYQDAGSHKILVRVSDGTSSLSRKWGVNVENVERALVFNKIGNRALNEGGELRIELNANDPDGDEVTYHADNIPEGAKLEENIFSWKPSFDTVKKEGFADIVMGKFRALSKNFYIQFTAVSKDKKIAQNVVITVKDVNRAPELEDMETITINEGEILKIVPKAYDLDGDKISISYSGFTNTDTFKSGFDDAGTYYVKVSASDGLLEASKFVQINIKQSNRAPVFSKIEGIRAKEGDNIAILLNSYDPDGDDISYSIDNPQEESSLKGNAFFWTPSFSTAGKKETKGIDLVFAASDGKAETRQIAKVMVSDKNRAPRIIDASKSIAAKINEPVMLFVKAVDEDKDELTYTWDFGLLEKYKATPTHQRTFTAKGAKLIKVKVSDGIDEAEQVINVNVA